MKIVLAFDSFKGCMTAAEACHTAALAIKETNQTADVLECPLSDGGEGLVDCIGHLLPLKRIHLKAHDPLMNIIDASYAIADNTTTATSEDGTTAYMEMATTSGLTLVPKEKRDPMLTTTYGVGEMLVDAARRGCKEIVMGIGGSATCDAGKGMLQAISDAKFKHQDLPHITVACDVTNPLYGKQGAAYIFAPQKGATPEQVAVLDKQLRDFANNTAEAGIATPEMADHPGAGAAGGLGYCLMTYLKAELKHGIDIILDINDFDNKIKNTTLLITGEGKSDEQTLMGKVPDGVLKRCRQRGIPVWLLSGCIEDKDGTLSRNFSLVKSINEADNRPLDTLMQPAVAKENLALTIQKLFNTTTINQTI